MAEPFLIRVLRGTSDANIRFGDLRALLLKLGFTERIRGSHHILTRPDVAEILKYEIILYWSNEDSAFIAEVPELPGCAADGATRQEALAKVEVVIAEWFETARELGRPIPEPRGRLLFA